MLPKGYYPNHHQIKFFILSCTNVGACLCPFFIAASEPVSHKSYINRISNPKGVIINFSMDKTINFYSILGIFQVEPDLKFVKTLQPMTLVVNADGMMDSSPLTARERDILSLWARGLQQKQIAAQLLLSPQTVKKHLRNVYKKLNAHNKVQALTKAGYL